MIDTRTFAKASGLITEAGFASAIDLLKSSPNDSLLTLAKRVPKLTAYELSKLLWREVTPEARAWLAKRIFIGQMHHHFLEQGWPGVADRPSTGRVAVFIASVVDSMPLGMGRTLTPVMKYLGANAPVGWLPRSTEDEHVTRGFETWVGDSKD